MAFFTRSQLLKLASDTVRVGTLVEFLFDPTPRRLWNGPVMLTTLDGREWLGLGELGSIEGLEETRNADSRAVTFTLSGASTELLALIAGEQSAIEGKFVRTYQQLFGKHWEPIGNPIAISRDICQTITVTRGEAIAPDGWVQTISIGAENPMFGRDRPAAGRYTDRDQQTRYPGDRFFEFQPQLANFTYIWPNF